jgi:SOS response regulatory protein OraA/RecX
LEEEPLQLDANCIKAEKLALRLIARAEQNVAGLTAKLEKRGVYPSIALQVISGLLEEKLLDDSRFAERWVHAHLWVKKALSPLWFLVSLEKRGISREICLAAINKVLDEDTEYSLLLKFIGRMDALTKETGLLRTKLRREGFSPEAINRFFDSE